MYPVEEQGAKKRMPLPADPVEAANDLKDFIFGGLMFSTAFAGITQGFMPGFFWYGFVMGTFLWVHGQIIIE